MSIPPRFVINATPEGFGIWLVKYTKGVWEEREFVWPVPPRIHLRLRPAHRRSTPNRGVVELVMEAYGWLEREGEKAGDFRRWDSEDIVFHATLLTRTSMESHPRTEVTERCYSEPLQEYVEELLIAIALRWPEAAEQLGLEEMEQKASLPQQRKEALPPEEHEGLEENPWEKIPDHTWHRQALELWWRGYTCPEIGERLHLRGKTVRNKLSALRGACGREIVPTKDDLRKVQRQSGHSGQNSGYSGY